jgi:uncharacterized protein (TIGR02996 family)
MLQRMDPFENQMIQAIRSRRHRAEDEERRLVYADWLEARGDIRAEFIRIDLAMRSLDPDHPAWTRAEDELSAVRVQCDPAWVELIEEAPAKDGRATTLERRRQDTHSEGWQRLLELIDEAATSGAHDFAPRRQMTEAQWAQIVTLPATITRMHELRTMFFYSSNLVRIPPEIAKLPNLVDFNTYTSYGLHWYPYELTHCPALRKSQLSTRTVYGNYKNRMRFPGLEPRQPIAPRWADSVTRPCSVCNTEFVDRGEHRVWISLVVATDVMALLVNACSAACIEALPPTPDNYVRGPHRGGRDLAQPRPR